MFLWINTKGCLHLITGEVYYPLADYSPERSTGMDNKINSNLKINIMKKPLNYLVQI